MDTQVIDCPCGSGKPFNACCGPLLSGSQLATTPEALMRSRYSAFTQANIDYLAKTMQGPAAARFQLAGLADWLKNITWLGLDVVAASAPTNDSGTVSFIARFEEQGTKKMIAEKSLFSCIAGKWFYVDGQTPSQNGPCLCHSGKKFKRCCGKL